MKLLVRFWQSVSCIGVNHTTDFTAHRRTILCNQFTGAVMVNTLGYTLAFVAHGVYSLLPVQICFLSLLGLVFFLNAKGFYAPAKNLFLMASAGIIFFFSLLFNKEAGSSLYYFPLGSAVCTLFDYRELKKAIPALAVLFVCILLLHLPDGYALVSRYAEPIRMPLTAGEKEALSLAAVLVSLLISMLCILHLLRINYLAETQLQQAFLKEEVFNQELQIREEELTANLEHLSVLSGKLEAEKAKLSAIVESADHLIYSVDAGYRLIHCNSNFREACRTRFGSEPRRGDPVLDLMPPEMAATWKTWYDAALSGKKFSVDNPGKTFFWEIFFTPIVGETGQVLGVSVFMQNITARKEAETKLVAAKEAAERATQAKAQFLSTMSHEIRTPMNAVIGMAHLLLEQNPRPDQLELLNTLHFSSQNLLSLINDILDLQKIESGKVVFEEIDFHLEELLHNIIYSHRFRAGEKGIGLSCRLHEAVPRVLRGDPVRLTQILNNLIGNAVKFTDQGEVILAVTPESGGEGGFSLHFAVSDTGIGIAPDKLTAIFGAFEQADADTTRKYGGTGLGLAITKQLLQLQGSRIEVASAPGKGSTFSFALRLKKAVSPTWQPRQDSPLLNVDLGHIRLLLAEDNPVNVMVARKFLAKWNITPDHAPDGRVALEKVQAGAYDLVLMDLQMPEMDGFEATTRIRGLGGPYASLPILALTADTMPEVKERALAAGMNGFLTKPYSPTDLYRFITRYASSGAGPAAPLPTPPALTGEDPAGMRFARIEELADGDEAFLRQLKGSCISELEDFCLNVGEAIRQRDETGLRATIHKAKPLLHLLDVPAMEGLLQAGRKAVNDPSPDAETGLLVRKITELCLLTQHELRESMLVH